MLKSFNCDDVQYGECSWRLLSYMLMVEMKMQSVDIGRHWRSLRSTGRPITNRSSTTTKRYVVHFSEQRDARSAHSAQTRRRSQRGGVFLRPYTRIWLDQKTAVNPRSSTATFIRGQPKVFSFLWRQCQMKFHVRPTNLCAKWRQCIPSAHASPAPKVEDAGHPRKR